MIMKQIKDDLETKQLRCYADQYLAENININPAFKDCLGIVDKENKLHLKEEYQRTEDNGRFL